MKKRNVVLIALYDLNSFPVCTLHASLKEAGFSVNSIFFKQLNPNNTMDSPTTNEVKALIKLIKDLEPLFVGISVRSTLFKLASKITEEIKKEVDTLVIWGGVHPIIRPIQSIQFTDIVCIGEGEKAVVELATKLSSGEKIDNIRNLWIKKNDKIIKNDLRSLIQNLDLLPFPDFSNKNKFLVENGNVLNLPDSEKKTSYWLMTSRGCPFNCAYCSNNILRMTYKGKGKYVRRRSVEDVIKELVYAKRKYKNVSYIAFEDDVFTFDINWIRKFCCQYKKTVNLPFFCYCHPKITSEEMIRLLKDAGAKDMTMGIQTGSEKIRHKYFKRYDTNEDIIRVGQILRKYKINCAYDVIMDNPLETSKDKRETFNLLLKLPKPFELHTHTLTHFPETELTNLLLEKKMISENEVEDQKQESYKRWTPTLDLRRDNDDLFWDNLYYLAKQKYVSREFVIWLSHNSLIKKHSKRLTLLLRLMSANIYTIRRGSKIDTARWYIISSLLKIPKYLFQRLQAKIPSRTPRV
ncbi:MAG: radical SAM protein [Candidatus Beckwithbacteria bacterium]|nr:radical SAM protein [Candidatus Beckwithbacteria bacterium]